MTEHEDLELGRCIQERLGVSCTRAYEANRLFKQNYDFQSQSDHDRLKLFDELAQGKVWFLMGMWNKKFTKKRGFLNTLLNH